MDAPPGQQRYGDGSAWTEAWKHATAPTTVRPTVAEPVAGPAHALISVRSSSSVSGSITFASSFGGFAPRPTAMKVDAAGAASGLTVRVC